VLADEHRAHAALADLAQDPVRADDVAFVHAGALFNRRATGEALRFTALRCARAGASRGIGDMQHAARGSAQSAAGCDFRKPAHAAFALARRNPGRRAHLRRWSAGCT
jgi:hypothetical protein